MLLGSIIVLAATGLLAPWVLPRLRQAAWFALPPAVVAVGLAWQAATAGATEVRESVAWFPLLGGSLDFRLDPFAALFAVLATGVGALIILYATGYLKGHPDLGRFLCYLFGFMAAMLGLVVADNLILLFVFWELTGITSYLLIGFNHRDKVARSHALQALLVTGATGLALLVGLILLADAAGTWRLSDIVGQDGLTSAPHYAVFTGLILLGAMAKSAQVPLHFWLPNAMSAPTPVSAFLHSATMVKAGVFLLARLSPALDGTALWHGTLMTAGALTMVTGAGLGLVQTDLKRILAHTTLSVLGALTLLIGVGTEGAMKAMLVLLVGHALYKAALFMTAGTVDHEVGSRDVRSLGALGRCMPLTAGAALLAAFSNAGLPPFFGFLGKEYTYAALLAAQPFAPLVVAAALATNIALFALALKVGWLPYWSGAGADQAVSPATPKVHEGPVSLWLPPLVLATAGLLLGLAPGLAAEVLFAPVLSAIAGHPVAVELSLWHGFSLPLLLSLATVAGGIGLYHHRRRVWLQAPRVEALVGPANVYDRGLTATIEFARRHTRSLQSGSLARYILITIGATAALIVGKFLRFGGWPQWTHIGGFDLTPALLCGTISVSAVVAATASRRLPVLLALGAIGLGIAVLFLYYSAPDLAITQLMVEALTVVLLLLAIDRLPKIAPNPAGTKIRLEVVIASMFGGVLGLLTFSAVQLQLSPSISETLTAWSYAEAHGRNVVNVTLVDFRALDTLGEIVVLAVASIGVASLLLPFGRKDPR